MDYGVIVAHCRVLSVEWLVGLRIVWLVVGRGNLGGIPSLHGSSRCGVALSLERLVCVVGFWEVPCFKIVNEGAYLAFV